MRPDALARPSTTICARAAADVRGRDGRHDLDDLERSGARRCARSRASAACGCTSTRPTPGRRRCCPSFAGLLDGAHGADSIVVNPHKWLFVPVDLSVLYVQDDPELLRRTFSLVADYLVTPETDVHNYMDYGLQLGRRFRALKLWFAIARSACTDLQAHLRGHIALAQEFAGWVARRAGVGDRRAASALGRVLSLRAARRDDEAALDALNAAIMDDVNATGESSSRRRSWTAARCCGWPSATSERSATTSNWPGGCCAEALPDKVRGLKADLTIVRGAA